MDESDNRRQRKEGRLQGEMSGRRPERKEERKKESFIGLKMNVTSLSAFNV